MEHEKRYDTLATILMVSIAFGADAFTVFALLVLGFPLIGIVIFLMAVAMNVIAVFFLLAFFVFKSEKNLLVWTINIVGALSGLILPVKFIWIGASVALGNSRLLRKVALDAALIAATVATGGAAAPAAIGEMAGEKAAETGVRAMTRRQLARAGKKKLEEELVEGGQGDLKKKEEEKIATNQALGEQVNPFEEMERLTSEVQNEEDDKFIDITGRRRSRKEDSRITDISGINAEDQEEEMREAA